MDYFFVFDIGGVVVRGFAIWTQIINSMGLNSDELVNGLPKKGSTLWEDLQKLQCGKFSSLEFLKNLAKKQGLPPPKENYWQTLFAPTQDKDTDALLVTLHKKGYRLVAGTNTIDVHYDYHIQHGDYRRFDFVYASHRIGQAKPDAAFWEYILNEENKIRIKNNKTPCTFAHMIFFDDTPDIIEAALKLGIKAFTFTNAHQAITDIKHVTSLCTTE